MDVVAERVELDLKNREVVSEINFKGVGRKDLLNMCETRYLSIKTSQ